MDKTMLPDKKAGKRYTRNELLERGWTTEMIDSLLRPQQAKNKTFYRASEVLTAKQDPEIAAQLEQNLALMDARVQVTATPLDIRCDMAKKFAGMLDQAYEVAALQDDVLSVASIWHRLFLSALKDQPQVIKDTPLLADEVMTKLDSWLAGKRNVSKWARSWRKCAQDAWVILKADEATDKAVKSYISTLISLANREVKELRDRTVTAPLQAILDIPAVKDAYPASHDLYYCYVTYYVPDSISRDLTKLLAVDPKDEYPEARMMQRRFEIHVGGTNTGKTFQSLQKLMQAKAGVYLAPLRLLALEVQERLLESGIVCSMLTGEEEDIREGATHISSTVEKLDVSKVYDVAVIDECQMINDRQRGYAWTRAILGVQAEEVHLCVAPEGLDILLKLLKDLKEPYDIVKHERKTPLSWEYTKVYPKQAQQGDAFVAFSKRKVLQMAETLRKNGTPASIIYGNLPYATRRQQMQMFLDGETTALVATDAIGMGLNLPIRRVIFMEDKKYDGEEVRRLKCGEVRQIAGRAGRFGIYDEGFAAAGPDCSNELAEMLDTIPENVQYASLGFSDLVLKVDHPLIDVLRIWNQMPVKYPYKRMDISRHIFVINYIKSVLHLDFSKEDQLRAGNIPFDEKDGDLLKLFGEYCKIYIEGGVSLPVPQREGRRLGDLELYYKKLDLYYSFSKNYGMTWDKGWLSEEKELVAEEINYLLIHDLKTRGASCRKCGGPLPLFSPYGMCDRCYHASIAAMQERDGQYWGRYTRKRR